MNEGIHKTLLSLKDVHGIMGSFVLDKDGALLAMDMPKLFDAAAFSELGPRIERLAESFSALDEEVESCMLRFQDHLIFVKQFPKGGSLCTLTEAAVNVPALKMAVNLAHKRIAPEMAAAPPLPTTNGRSSAAAPAGIGMQPAAAAGAPTTAAPASAAAAPAPKAQRFYRGHLVED